jgi:hypothetical protein
MIFSRLPIQMGGGRVLLAVAGENEEIWLGAFEF